MTLLERFKPSPVVAFGDGGRTEFLTHEEREQISRAIAIAQAVEEDLHCGDPNVEHDAREIMRRADELLEGK